MKLTFIANLLLTPVVMMQAAEAQQRKLTPNTDGPRPASPATKSIIDDGLISVSGGLNENADYGVPNPRPDQEGGRPERRHDPGQGCE